MSSWWTVGTLIADYETGADCIWTKDILWPAGKAPKHLLAFVSGITVCPGWVGAPPNGVYLLTQQLGDACEYAGFPPLFVVRMSWDGNTHFSIFAPPFRQWFGGTELGIGLSVGSDSICNVPNVIGFGGSALAFPASAGLARLLAWDFNFAPLSEHYSDRWDILPTKYMVSMCSTVHKSNILAIWNPELYP